MVELNVEHMETFGENVCDEKVDGRRVRTVGHPPPPRSHGIRQHCRAHGRESKLAAVFQFVIFCRKWASAPVSTKDSDCGKRKLFVLY